MDYSVLVVDFGSQYNQLVVRRIRELNRSSILISVSDFNNLIKEDKLDNVKAIIFSGGPNIVTDNNALKVNQELFNLNIPILGICYGMQLMSNHYGASLEESNIKEYGSQQINILEQCDLFNNLSSKEDVWMSHGYEVNNPTEYIKVTSKTNDGVISSIKIKDKPFYGTQFHLEVTDTINGMTMLQNFLEINNVLEDYSTDMFVENRINSIKEQVQDDKVLLGLSGGVDSSVVAMLINKAISNNLVCIFVDHGLLRKNEVKLVLDSLKKYNLNIIVADAKDRFLKELKDIIDPEQKRKIIGRLFVEIFEEEANKLDGIKYLAQGTLYTDIIESGTDTAHTIKSHHNVGGLPEKLGLKLLEPVNDLFKDEVRKVGYELGLTSELINRKPFPGPGLAIRIIGDITQEKINIVKESDAILNTMLESYKNKDKIWQSFTLLTNTLTVGVKGDERSYEYVLAIRLVESIDGMTARAHNIDTDFLLEISKEITNNVKGINRVVYDITHKPPSTIEWE